MFRTGDPLYDFERHDAEQEQWLSKLPVCEVCGEPIQQEKAVYYNDQWFCKEHEAEAWQVIREDFLESVVD